MNRELGYKFEHMKRAKTIEDSFIPNVDVTPVVDKKKNESDSLLSIIYAKDSFNLPSGDLQYYVNSKANPEIKKFILDNLMMDVSSVAAPKNSAIDNDTAFALMRKDGESVDAYMERVNEFGRANFEVVRSVKMPSHLEANNAPAE